MLSAEQNRLLTEVEGDAPMGRMMRARYWIPFGRSGSLLPDGAPERVTLLGTHYVAFRATDGRIGFFDEACPHRGVSLVLARNEECGLRCIFHGWKFDVSGKVTEIPSEGDRGAKLAEHIELRHYPTFEGGGIVWVFLGDGPPPPRPPLPFLDLDDDHVWVSRSVAPCNWFQGVEGTIDSIHVGTLHQSWIKSKSPVGSSARLSLQAHPRYEVEHVSYGLRAAALRDLPNGQQYTRVTEYVMPFVSLVPGGSMTDGTIFIATPINNTSHYLFWGFWDEDKPRIHAEKHMTAGGPRDHDNYARIDPGPDWTFGQDRAAMADGHFTGLTGCILEEDMIVQASMGAIADRTIENLCSSDVGLVQARRRILAELAAFEKGEAAAAVPDIVRPVDIIAKPGYAWRETVAS